jgi:hypothetical protein
MTALANTLLVACCVFTAAGCSLGAALWIAYRRQNGGMKR